MTNANGSTNVMQRAARMVIEFLVAGLCAIGFGITAQMFIFSLVSSDSVGTRDFSVYWATGRQLVHHGNPYGAKEMLSTEISLGFPAEMGVKFMRNPPWMLPIAYPLGFMSVRMASIIWSLLLLALLVISVRLVWILHGRPKTNRTLLGYSFAPAVLCLIIGQSSIFALFGLVLFLSIQRKHPFFAGCSLWLCMMKPHLFLPFGCVLLVWIYVSRSYKVLAGTAMMVALSAAIATAIDRAAWSQYAVMVHGSGIEVDYIPCLSFLLRKWINLGSFWIQYVPATIGCVWAVGYYWRRRETWDWIQHSGSVLLVSILVAPYCWLFDQVLAIPALLHGAYAARSRDLVLVLAFASALIEGAFFENGKYPSAIYLWTLWTAPGWVIWYWFATRTNAAYAMRLEIEPGAGEV
jgi:Glycosyltransferase family 87